MTDKEECDHETACAAVKSRDLSEAAKVRWIALV